MEFFEARIRPVLVESCYPCHSASAAQVFAGLRLDSAVGLRKGSDTGPIIVPGDPPASKLINVLHGRGASQMPPTGKLPAERIADLTEWVRRGGPWPEEGAAAPAEQEKGFDLEARRRSHWAWQPVAPVEPPIVDRIGWPLDAVDRYLLASLEEHALEPAPEADRRTLIRRLSFDLHGLPPTPERVEAFAADQSPDSYPALVDELLASPRFGERWARRWMDLFRYAETHGSEGDPITPQAWRYRDYLIRAINADVPYDQLIREHLAGDLLPSPRIDSDLGLNESILGTAHFRLVEHGFQPVDPWEDRIKWTDNQIDVVSKALQGLTVSCARCHDHKFDAISQADYYAMFGVVKGARPIQRAIDSAERLHKNRDRLATLKGDLRERLAEAWGAASAQLEKRLLGREVALEESGAWAQHGPLRAWALLHDQAEEPFRKGWEALTAFRRLEADARRRFNDERFDWQWDLSLAKDYGRWLRAGTGLGEAPSSPGEFAVELNGDRVLRGVYPAGAYSHLLSPKHAAVLQSPRFTVDSDYISFSSAGDNFSFVRLVIENYAVPRGGIYHQRYSPKKDEFSWYTWKTDYWKGFSAYLEYATLEDSTNFTFDPEDSRRKPRPTPRRDGRSWFGAGQVVFHNRDETPQPTDRALELLLDAPQPESAPALAALYSRLLGQAVDAWRDGRLNANQAAYLDFFVRADLLPTSLRKLEALRPLVEEYRRLEKEIPVPRRAPGVLEEGGPPQPLLVRGNRKSPAEPIARRYLTAFGGEIYSDPSSGRLRVAEQIASPDNPLTARVAANRIWSYLFGRGLVRTVDNFGKLGEPPSHPALLDHLAAEFVAEGWSIKSLVRSLTTSRAYRMGSLPSQRALAVDPENSLLQHMPVRRLDAEAIRDSLLAVSGRLDIKMYGPSVPVYYAFAKGKTKGDKLKGPLDGEGRRSVYQEIRRNAHNPFLEAFDLPKPAGPRGRRDVTNVPAQSLTMLNSPFVIGQAAEWAKRLTANQNENRGERIERMFLAAFARPPSAAEKDRAETLLTEFAGRRGQDAPPDAEAAAWQDLAHSLFNLKEFLYIR